MENWKSDLHERVKTLKLIDRLSLEFEKVIAFAPQHYTFGLKIFRFLEQVFSRFALATYIFCLLWLAILDFSTLNWKPLLTSIVLIYHGLGVITSRKCSCVRFSSCVFSSCLFVHRIFTENNTIKQIEVLALHECYSGWYETPYKTMISGLDKLCFVVSSSRKLHYVSNIPTIICELTLHSNDQN